jgi:sugar O-acyltransferase (sialic acid O-acetyltransferase NeuD family)
MLVIGAGGHAKEVVEIIHRSYPEEEIFFFDNTDSAPAKFLNRFRIVSKEDEIREIFRSNPSFISAISGTRKKEIFLEKFHLLGGRFAQVIAANALIGSFNVDLGKGLNIMQNVLVSNDVSIGDATLVNYGACIHHDCRIGKYCEISPRAQLLGGVKVGDYVTIGSGAIILPKITIGNNSIIGAGAVITGNVPDNVIVTGVPGKVVKKIE